MFEKAKRVSLPLKPEGARKLAELAQRVGVTQTEILRRALATYDYLKSTGGEVRVTKPSGDVVEVILP